MALHAITPLIAPGAQEPGRPRVFFKMDCFQEVGSFKIRGIGNICEHYARHGKTRFISSSGGNAGYAVAYAGFKLGIPVTVIVPRTTAPQTRQRIERLGALVQVHGQIWDEADQLARQLAQTESTAYISPFDHPLIWEGHASVVDELVRQCEHPPDAIVLSVGGGGLLCGVAEGLRKHHWHDTTIVAVETEGAASLAAAVKAGRVVEIPAITSIATSLGARQVADQALQHATSGRVHSVVVSDADAVNACLRFLDEFRVLTEPACGASLAVVYGSHERIQQLRNVVVVVCGGIGVDLQRLLDWKQHTGASPGPKLAHQ